VRGPRRTALRTAAMARFSARTARLSGDTDSTRKRLRSGGRRGRQKDTVFLRQRVMGNPPVVGAKQPRRVVEAELRSALAAPLGERFAQARLAPHPPDPLRHLLRAVRVEDQPGIADDVGKPRCGGAGDGEAGGERLADREAPALESAREDEGRCQLVEPAQLEAADESREPGGLGETEPLNLILDLIEVLGLPPRADEGDRDPLLVADPRERLEQAAVILVRPGLRRV